jgi:autotransporter-associated beta strand protein
LVTTTGAVGSVVLHVTTGATGDTWTAGNGTWDINNTASWNVGNYLETTLSGDAVLFDDSASGSGPFAVTLDTVVNPIGVTVSNLSKDYTISGLGGIAGWGNLTKQGAGKLTLDTTNAYYGDTVIGAGTLALGGTGSISNTANLNLAAGATFDVSAIASYALPPGSGLIASGTAAASATIKGGTTVSFGSRRVALTFAPTAFSGDPAHPALVISQGTLALGGNGFTVHNAGGTALGDGTYNLINVTSGNVTGVPTVAAVTVTGAGLLVGKAAYLSVSGGNVVLTVMTATTTTLNSLATPATYGDNVTFTALVDPSLSSGTVQFYDNGAAWGSPVALSGGIAAYSTTNLAAGSHPITAAYGGTTGYWPSATASAALQVVNPALLSVIMYPQSKRYGNRLYGNSDGTGYEAQDDGTNWVVIYTTNSWFATGLVNGERLTNAYVNMVPGGGATEPVGAYPGANPPDSSGIFTDAGTATFLGDRGFKVANYMVIRYPADYVITPAPLTITALPQSKAYGDTLALGTTAFVAAGLRNGETVGSVTLTATAGPPDGTAAGDPAGAYTLAPSAATGGTFTESNYTISYVAGTLSVLIPFALNTAFPARVSWASQAGATYTVQYKDDLNVAGWTALTNVLAVGASTTLTDSTRPLPAQRFYRVISP